MLKIVTSLAKSVSEDPALVVFIASFDHGHEGLCDDLHGQLNGPKEPSLCVSVMEVSATCSHSLTIHKYF